MTQELAISARGLGKRYHRGASAAQYTSLRDMMLGMVQNLTKKSDGPPKTEFWALKDASFDIRRGENVGIIGLNGAGKSTLLKVLSKITTPTEGRATIYGRLGALLEVGTGFHRELTGRENVFLYGAILGMTRDEVLSKFDAIIEFSEIKDFIDTPVKHYSSGMYVRLAFSVAAHLDPDILLLDEVLAVGDFAFQKKCMDFARGLEKKGATILFVSHNMFSIKTMCERVIYLKGGKVIFDGPTDEGLRIYEDDIRLAPPAWFKNDGERPPFHVTGVDLLDANGVEKTVFDYGERMTFRIHYETTRPLMEPDIRVGINRLDDVHCCSYSTQSDGVSPKVLEGSGVIEMTTPPLNLTSELYTVTVVVRERNELLNAQMANTFHVRHEVIQPNTFGVFHDAGEWKINSGVAQIESLDRAHG